MNEYINKRPPNYETHPTNEGEYAMYNNNLNNNHLTGIWRVLHDFA